MLGWKHEIYSKANATRINQGAVTCALSKQIQNILFTQPIFVGCQKVTQVTWGGKWKMRARLRLFISFLLYIFLLLIHAFNQCLQQLINLLVGPFRLATTTLLLILWHISKGLQLPLRWLFCPQAREISSLGLGSRSL